MLRKRLLRITTVLVIAGCWLAMYHTITSARIIPVETQKVYLVHDYEHPSGRQFCTIESLCRANKNTIMYAKNSTMVQEFLPSICNEKVKVHNLDYNSVFYDTAFSEWFRSTKNQKSPLWKYDVADAARWAIIQKYGGTYSDLDIIYFGPDRLQYTNRVAAQHDTIDHGHYLNSNFFTFEKNHKFVHGVIQKFVALYHPNHDWGSNGPGLLTTTWNECKAEHGDECSRIELLDADKLQLIRPGTLREILSMPKDSEQGTVLRNRLANESIGIHFSNSEIGWHRFAFGSLFHHLFTEYCPTVSDMFTNELFE
jgi:hypothetical protein